MNLFDSISRIARFKAQAAVEQRHAADLIDLKVRDCEDAVRRVKRRLADLIVRERSEERLASGLRRRIADMETRVTAALEAGNEKLAEDGARALADMENDLAARDEALATLRERIVQVRGLLERTHSRLVRLRGDAVSAKAVLSARQAGVVDAGHDAFGEADDLIKRLTGGPDVSDEADVLYAIDRSLDGAATADRMADAGFGPATRATSATVLARLRAKRGE